MASLRERGFVALDDMTHRDALALAARLRGLVYGVKIEHLLYGTMGNLETIACLKDMGFKIFADAKLFSTPGAVAASVKALAQNGADLISVHVASGSETLQAAIAAYRAVGVRDYKRDEAGMGILGLTVLTSMTDQECKQAYGLFPIRATQQFGYAAMDADVYGIICSPLEAILFKNDARRRKFKIVTPGIVPKGHAPGRHVRSNTPEEALVGDADLLVIGAPITKSADPLGAIARIDETIANLP